MVKNCKLNFAYKKQNVEKIWVGVKILGGKNPKKGKNLGVGVILDRFGKIYHTFTDFSDRTSIKFAPLYTDTVLQSRECPL